MSSEEPRTVNSLDPRGGREALIARQVRKRSRKAKIVVGCDELGGDAVQSDQGGFLLVRAEVSCRPGFGIACAWEEEVQLMSRKTLGFVEKSV
jgi:hypothetical protein